MTEALAWDSGDAYTHMQSECLVSQPERTIVGEGKQMYFRMWSPKGRKNILLSKLPESRTFWVITMENNIGNMK